MKYRKLHVYDAFGSRECQPKYLVILNHDFLKYF